MNQQFSPKKLPQKLLVLAAKILGVGSVVILLDALIFGSIYHPLTYKYKWQSWMVCKSAPKDKCKNVFDQKASTLSQGKSMVVSSQHIASEVGAQILRAGGNAIDAAVAVGYALAVTYPCCGNLGGGGFMVIRLADGSESFIDFRETAPLAATEDMYLDEEGNIIKGLSTKGYLAVGVPGTVKGLEYALTKYGTMSREQVLAPSIKIAKEGFTLQQGDVDIFEAGKRRLSQSNVAEIFLKNDQVYQSGDVLVQSDLANTLQAISNKGIEAFYQGEIAQKVVAASKENDGILSLEDFANYKVRESEPVKCNYRGYQVISSAPPGGGTTVCQMLNILSGYDLKQSGWRTGESLHYILSSMLLAFSDRNQYLGDPNFVDNPTEKLLSEDYAQELRDKITTEAIDPNSVYLNTETEGTNTTHYSVVDEAGNAVAVTYTINSYFGAGVIAPGTGFILNNEMDDFTSKVGAPNQFGLRQGKANQIQPGKRPLSSMSPTIVTKDGKLVLVTGSPGGSTIPTTVLQMISNIVDYEMSIEEAVKTPRIHYQGLPNVVLNEPYAINSQTLINLWEKGYKVTPWRFWGAAESIYIDPETNLKFSTHDSRQASGKAVVP